MHVATRPMHLEVNVEERGSKLRWMHDLAQWRPHTRATLDIGRYTRLPSYGNEESAESKVPTDLITKILLVAVPLRSSTPRSLSISLLFAPRYPAIRAIREFSPHYSGFISGYHSGVDAIDDLENFAKCATTS